MISIIQDEIEKYFNLPSGSIQRKTRKREIVMARQLAHWFALDRKIGSLTYIGLNLGGVDHATVLHSKKTVNNLIDTDKKFRVDFRGVEINVNKAIFRSSEHITKEEIMETIQTAVNKRFSEILGWNKIYKEMLKS